MQRGAELRIPVGAQQLNALLILASFVTQRIWQRQFRRLVDVQATHQGSQTWIEIVNACEVVQDTLVDRDPTVDWRCFVVGFDQSPTAQGASGRDSTPMRRR